MAPSSMPAAFLGLSLLCPAPAALAAVPGEGAAAPPQIGSTFGEKRDAAAQAPPLGAAQAGVTAPAPHLRQDPQDGIKLAWHVAPSSPYVGQTIAVTLSIRMPEGWAKDSLVQLFQQELSLPVQIEAFSLTPEGLTWIEPDGSAAVDRHATTLVLDGDITRATGDDVVAQRLNDLPIGNSRVVTIERLARALRPGAAVLEAPIARFTSATSFREDFVQGRTPIDPKRQEARGRRLEIPVQRLPEEGRPLGFDGAIGSFELSAQGPTRAIEVGAAFDLAVEVTGTDRLSPTVRPRLVGMDGFSKLGMEREDRGGTATFRVSLSATRLDRRSSPTVEFDTFDPATGKYILAASRPAPLAIKAKRDRGGAIGDLTPDSQTGFQADSGAATGPQATPRPASADDPDGSTDGDSPRLAWTASVLSLVGLLALISAVRRISHRSRIRSAARHAAGSAAAARPYVLMIGKYPLQAAAGDMVSVRRLEDHLSSAGFRVSYSPVTEDGELGVPPASIPSLVHALNAEGPATLGAKFAKEWGVPLVVTTTGTDINRGLMELDRRGAVLANLKAADRILTLTQAQSDAVKQAEPRARVERITQGVLLEGSDFDLRKAAAVPAGRRVALMLGGLRPVKGQKMAIEAWGTDFGWQLVIVGEAVDPAYAAEVQEAARTRDHVTVLGPLAHQDAIAALASADALLNTSDSEGESRAVLEAMALGTPVIARRNPGNSALIQDGLTGLLFDRADEIPGRLAQLGDEHAVVKIVSAAKGVIEGRDGQEHDEDALGRIYRELIGEVHFAEAATPSHQPPAPVGN